LCLNDLSQNPAARGAYKRNQWNHLRIQAIGNSIKTWTNGVPAADLKDDADSEGFIAFQVFGTKLRKKMRVMWKNIRIKEINQLNHKYSASEKKANINDGLVLHFDFEDVRPGGKVIDKSGRGNHGIIKDGKIVGGKIGNALECKYENKVDGVLVKDDDSLDVQQVTVAAWIKTDRLDEHWNRVVAKGWKTAYNLGLGGDHKGKRYRTKSFFEAAKRTVGTMDLDINVVDGKWHFLAGSYDGQVLKFYIDGDLVKTKKSKNRKEIPNNNYDLMIGNSVVPLDPPEYNYFDGLIDEVRVYNRVLSEDEIQLLYKPASKTGSFMRSIFNGKDLSGWNLEMKGAAGPAPKKNIWWTVKDEVLLAKGGPNMRGSILWTNKAYRDFVVELKFRLSEGNVDSGVFLRNGREQIQVGTSNSLKRDMTCCPFLPKVKYAVDAKVEERGILKPKDWNTMKIQAIGNEYTVWLNSEKVVQYQSKTAIEEGPIGLQLRENMTIEFKDIKAVSLP